MKKNIRLYILGFLVVLGGATVSSRLFFLQISRNASYTAQAQIQQGFSKVIEARRGEIFAQDKSKELFPLAVDKDQDLVYAVPKEINEPAALSPKLAAILGLPEVDILAKISKPNDPYELLKKKLTQQEVDALSGLKVAGIYLGAEAGRLYPSNGLASHILGFTSPDKDGKLVGRYGLEEYYNQELTGKPGFFEGDKDTQGYWIFGSKGRDITPAQNGANLILTVDPNIQFEAEKMLSEAAQHWQAEGGTVIVMEPQTGKILALADWPAFNPNEYGKEKIGTFLNAATQTIYEPGSAFKPITMASGLDAGAVTPDTTYNDKGQLQFGRYTVSNFDHKGRGVVNMVRVLQESLNTGAVFVQQKLGKELFREYVKKFGFGEKTGVDLPAEVKGKTSGLYTAQDINFATASFGQGIAVTPMELVRAVAALANGGKMVRPYLVDKIDYGSGNVKETAPQTGSEVISGQTSAKIAAMMVAVVENGQAKRAQISGYAIAGKTGTAQIPDPKGGYQEATIHNFVGFAPAFNPRFAILAKLDKPKVQYAESSVGPVFHDLAKYILDYYQIPPDNQQAANN